MTQKCECQYMSVIPISKQAYDFFVVLVTFVLTIGRAYIIMIMNSKTTVFLLSLF